MTTAERREELKAQLTETDQTVRRLKLLLTEKCEPQLVRDLNEKKRQRRQLQIELGDTTRLMGRKEMHYSTAFLQVAKRLLPAQIFRELRLATHDYRELEDDTGVEEMLLERREYVEEAVRGVRY